MNRSFSQSFKLKSQSSKSKQNNSNISFKTVWKFRNSSQAFQNSSANPVSRSQIRPSSSLIEQNRPSTVDADKSQKMKAFVKTMKTTQKEQTIRKQIGSFKQSGRSNREISINTSRVVENKGQQMEKLEYYDKLVGELIRMKLQKKNKKNFMMLRQYEDQIDIELKDIAAGIKELKDIEQNQEGPRQPVVDLQQISRKICIFEKLIADSHTESEMLKRYFYHKKLLRKRFSKPKSTVNLKCENFKNLTFLSSFGSPPSIQFQTTNQASFSKPDRSSYSKNKKNNRTYVKNEQTVPRSVYQQEYFNYGALPVYHYKRENNYVNTEGISQNTNSIYKKDFQPAKSQKLDINDLDCKKDKIKPTNLWFLPRKNCLQGTQKSDNKQEKKSELKKQNRKINRPSYNYLLGAKSTANKQNLTKAQTESQSQYINKSVTIESMIKDKSLMGLKSQYKMFAYA